jgi:DNA-binding Lrp family transcriptional regulator
MDRLESLAKRVNVSRTTVASYTKWMAGESKTSDKRYFRVSPDLDESALEMKTVDVLIETPTIDSVEKVETLCDKHPYTKYRARCYGGESKIFAQFRIPINTSKMLTRFLNEAEKRNDLAGYEILPTDTDHSLFTTPQLKCWNNSSFTWDFDWDKWAKKSVSKEKPKRPTPSTSKLNLLKKSDVAILGMLPLGVRRKQRHIMDDLKAEGFEFTSQEFSRRLRVLKENFITRYHVYLDIDAFDLYSNILITANISSKFSSDLQNRLQKSPIPFRSTLKATDDFMMWYLRLPPSHLSHLLNYLHENVKRLSLSMVDYQKTEVYRLWAEAFNDDSGGWRKDTDFLLCR